MFLSRFLISNLFSVFLVGAILLLKKVLKNRVTLRFHYHIWFALLFSLIVVFAPTSFFESANLNDIAQEITAPTINSDAVADMPNDWRYDFTEMADSFDSIELTTVLSMAWVIGALGVAGFYYMGSRKLRMIKRFSEAPSEEITAVFNDCRKQVSVNCKVHLLQSDMITSPLSFGCRHSYIILPSSILQSSSQGDIEHILLHELTHIKHKDIWVNFWFCAEQVIYWFNPLIWWAFSKMRRDREAYCDWSVLNAYNSDEERLCYGDTLLQFVSMKNNMVIYTANSLFDNKAQIKYRIERIANFKKETRIARFVGCLLVVSLTLAATIQVPVLAVFASDLGLSYEPSHSINMIEQDYSDLFGAVSGCAIIYDMQSDTYDVYNPAAITKRIAPCSTCKIYSAINALEQGVITPSNNTLAWDHQSRDYPTWNADQNLKTALRNSVNWYFQLLDGFAGADELKQFYTSIGYGNGYIGNDTDYYWNGSSLRISPLEQVELLEKLYNNEFGFDEANVNAIKDAIFLSDNNGNKFYGKTGTGKVGSNDVTGWFIGFVEADDNTYFFAISLQDESNASGNNAVQITYAIFEETGIKLD